MLNNCIILLLSFFLFSCDEPELPGYKYSLYEDTPVYELALAIKDDDSSWVNSILKDTTIDVNYQETKFGKSLLEVAIVNQKKKAFLSLLENGANPNLRGLDVGHSIISTPFITSCMSGGAKPFFCNTYYMEQLLIYGADPNSYEIRITPDGLSHQINALLIAISKKSEVGDDCIEPIRLLIKSGADIDECTDIEGYGAITKSLILDRLKIAKYLIVNQKATILDTVYIRRKGTPEEHALSISDLLLEEDYINEPGKRRSKLEILNYLDSIGKK